MIKEYRSISTGNKGLDEVITGLHLGDNVVWQIDAIEDYADIVRPFVEHSKAEKKRIVYIRFAQHAPLLTDSDSITTYTMDPESGFESFSTELHQIIKNEGEGVYYIFDCLSDLLSTWSNDLMVGNFFKITCPYLFELNTIAYFSLLRNHHSFKTIARIRDTTQLLIDVFLDGPNCYIHPLKVWNRYSPTMFLPHIKRKDKLIPIANSVDTARLFSHVFKKGAKTVTSKLDYWDRLFMNAEDLSQKKNAPQDQKAQMVEQLSKLIISKDEKILKLAKENFVLEDFIQIRSRMIGTGYIGGKSVGMLIARSILAKDRSLQTDKFFEPHDSFYIGADVFYTYIVENSWWKERMEQRTEEGYFAIARALKQKLLTGHFPPEIKEQFLQMIEYFGQSPIIVRSSSLLEDGYGNAFAGKYDSIFLPNQGTPEERFAAFVHAVRQIYASTMNEDALVYRKQRGLDKMDEQMALLVQRVSGSYHNEFFFPDLAGVGISYNAFVWKNHLDPQAGMLRLVFGLGTRAVNRVEGDYPRIVALDDPLLKPHANISDTQKFSQHYVDVIDTRKNSFETISARKILNDQTDLPLDLLATLDNEATEKLHEMGIEEKAWIITFDELLSKTSFTATMRHILKTLEASYGYPVDVEFTINFKNKNNFQINLVQCRPMQTKGLGVQVNMPEHVPDQDLLFRSNGHFLGGNIAMKIDQIIYVDPKNYCTLASQVEKYDIARAIGDLNRTITSKEERSIMLLGPGRWGTSTPSLGVPVSFAEINNISILGELAFSTNNVMPELSYGTHFFQDLVETGIFYLALFPDDPQITIAQSFFEGKSRLLSSFFPNYAKYDPVIKIFEFPSQRTPLLKADIRTQELVCYFSGD